ncbi:prolactin-releasing peptide receptor-like [Carcharodon carcharias]|uniref:prolactin-releasing peptide receptor-like n=1 Tax=Carcharodon carcharias TaxID=13397 RepID=UPI001B7DB4D8|nr:prolactin-releasing peptide receptor-like [Carcharodon carcharias]
MLSISTESWSLYPANTTTYQLALMDNANSSSQFTGVTLIQSFKPLIIPCYVLLVFVGIVGNYLLLYVICKTKKMHNVTNFFIGNLAFSDMLMCATCVPFTLAYAFHPRGWVFGTFMCYFVFLMQPVTVYVSVFTLTAIAVDRYYATVHPLKKRISIGTCMFILAGVWLVSCAVSAPALAHTYHVEFQDQGQIICEEFWIEKAKEHLAYAYTTLIVTYILPLSAVSLSYLRITLKLKNRVVPGNATHSQERWEKVKRKKIFRLLVLVVAAFGACWLPLHVFNIIRDIDINLINKDYFNLIQLLCHFCAMTSACCNPFLYAWLHDRFRAELKRMFACKKKIVPSNNCIAVSVVL